MDAPLSPAPSYCWPIRSGGGWIITPEDYRYPAGLSAAVAPPAKSSLRSSTADSPATGVPRRDSGLHCALFSSVLEKTRPGEAPWRPLHLLRRSRFRLSRFPLLVIFGLTRRARLRLLFTQAGNDAVHAQERRAAQPEHIRHARGLERCGRLELSKG
jgi:hypothetical protein